MASETVVLGIDAPEMDIQTSFREARATEAPREKDPFFQEEGRLLTTHIVVKHPNDGAGILKDIRQQWEKGQSAWASQHLPTDDELHMRIVGFTVVSQTPYEVVFRLYTPE